MESACRLIVRVSGRPQPARLDVRLQLPRRSVLVVSRPVPCLNLPVPGEERAHVTGLEARVTLLAFHGIRTDLAHLKRGYARSGEMLGRMAMIRAARGRGPKARKTRSNVSRLARPRSKPATDATSNSSSRLSSGIAARPCWSAEPCRRRLDSGRAQSQSTFPGWHDAGNWLPLAAGEQRKGWRRSPTARSANRLTSASSASRRQPVRDALGSYHWPSRSRQPDNGAES